MLFCRLLASGIGTITVSLRYSIAGAYKRLYRKVNHTARGKVFRSKSSGLACMSTFAANMKVFSQQKN